MPGENWSSGAEARPVKASGFRRICPFEHRGVWPLGHAGDSSNPSDHPVQRVFPGMEGPAKERHALPRPFTASFDAAPAVLPVPGSVSRRLEPRRYLQALGSARFVVPTPANATAVRCASLTNSVQLGPAPLALVGLCPCGPFASPSLLCFVILSLHAATSTPVATQVRLMDHPSGMAACTIPIAVRLFQETLLTGFKAGRIAEAHFGNECGLSALPTFRTRAQNRRIESCESPGPAAQDNRSSEVCQRIFSPVSTFQWVGNAWLSSTPRAPKPLYCGQLSAPTVSPTHKIAAVSPEHESARRSDTGLGHAGGRVVVK
jgi:hypothetical protein